VPFCPHDCLEMVEVEALTEEAGKEVAP
jgi:hypothetical protein